MIIDWRTDKNAPNGIVIDCDTGLPLTGKDGYCCYMNDETGEWMRYKKRDGKLITDNGKPVIEGGKSRLRFFAAVEEVNGELKIVRGLNDLHLSEKQ